MEEPVTRSRRTIKDLLHLMHEMRQLEAQRAMQEKFYRQLRKKSNIRNKLGLVPRSSLLGIVQTLIWCANGKKTHSQRRICSSDLLLSVQ